MLEHVDSNVDEVRLYMLTARARLGCWRTVLYGVVRVIADYRLVRHGRTALVVVARFRTIAQDYAVRDGFIIGLRASK